MKVNNKKPIIALVGVLVFALVGLTFAYFQSSASFENVFNTGTYKVVTTEVFESPDNWKPGEEIPKTITTKNEGTIDAAVRVSYTEQWLDENDQDITSQITAGTAIINLDNTGDWTKEGNYYYYNYILKPTESTSSFMKSVTLNPDLNGVTCTGEGLTRTCESTNPATGAKYILTLTKETVQADKYDTIWNTEVEITVKNSGSSSSEQDNSGSETPSNPYLTTFDGSYTYLGPGGSTEFDPQWTVYVRNNGTINEVCGVFGSAQASTVCINAGNGSDWNTDFPEEYHSENPYNSSNTSLNGYTKAKLDEMLLKGATQCEVNNDSGYAGCSNADGLECHISEYGSVECYAADNSYYCNYNGCY